MLLAAGQSVEEVCKKLEVSPPTCHHWRQEYGRAKEETVKRLKDLEKENARLKGLVAICPLDKAILQEVARRNGTPGARTRSGAAVRHELQVSEHRACTTIRQPRSTQRYRRPRRSKDAALPAELRRTRGRHASGSTSSGSIMSGVKTLPLTRLRIGGGSTGC
jgi:putative transposase